MPRPTLWFIERLSDWTEYLGDPSLVMALLDRVVDNAIVIRFEGKSYRQHRAE